MASWRLVQHRDFGRGCTCGTKSRVDKHVHRVYSGQKASVTCTQPFFAVVEFFVIV